MAFCAKCGAKLNPGDKYCYQCGAPVSANAEASRSPVQGYYSAPGGDSPAAEPVYSGNQPSKSGVPVAVIAVVTILLVIVGIAAGFAAVKGSRDKESVLGRYEGVSCLSEGIELGAEGEWVELSSGGRAEIHILGDTYRGKWSLDGENITVTQDGDKYHGTLRDRALQINFEGLDYTFSLDGAALPSEEPDSGGLPAEASETSARPTEALPTTGAELPTSYSQQDYPQVADYWSGDWYGWWTIQNATGSWEELDTGFWDACARFRVNEDGSGYVEIWDEDSEEGECFCVCSGVFDTSQAKQGILVSKRGVFLDMEIDQNDWWVYPEMGLGVDNGICITGTYIDPEVPEDTFDYEIYLRPWGTLWDDLKDTSNPSCPYDNMMPGLYESWYLPLIESGVTQAPDKIGE